MQVREVPDKWQITSVQKYTQVLRHSKWRLARGLEILRSHDLLFVRVFYRRHFESRVGPGDEVAISSNKALRNFYFHWPLKTHNSFRFSFVI